jgi:Fe-S cluster assembly iron-binding protein IscA
VLTLTDNARLAVQDLADQANLPTDGGLRIAAAEDAPGDFDLALVVEPTPTDEVIDLGTTHVFVAESTAPALTDLSLDAEPKGEATAFSLTPQA